MSFEAPNQPPEPDMPESWRLGKMPELAYQIPFNWGTLQVTPRAAVNYELIPRVPVETSTLEEDWNSPVEQHAQQPRLNIFIAEPESAQKIINALHPGKPKMTGTHVAFSRDERIDSIISFKTSIQHKPQARAYYFESIIKGSRTANWRERAQTDEGFVKIFSLLLQQAVVKNVAKAFADHARFRGQEIVPDLIEDYARTISKDVYNSFY